MSTPEIRPLTNTPQTLAQLAEVLIATVAAGGSVGFMHPVSPAQAQAFWQAALSEADAGNRVIFGAWDGQR